MRARNLLHLKAGSAPLLFSGWRGTRLKDFAWHSVLCRPRRRRKRTNTVPPIATTETPTPGLLSTDRRLVVLVLGWVRHRLWTVSNLILSEVFKTLVGKLRFRIDRWLVVCLPSWQLEEAKVFRRSNITWQAAIFTQSRARHVLLFADRIVPDYWKWMLTPCVFYHIAYFPLQATCIRFECTTLWEVYSSPDSSPEVESCGGSGSHISHFLIAVRRACGGVEWNVWYARNQSTPNLKYRAVWVPWLCWGFWRSCRRGRRSTVGGQFVRERIYPPPATTKGPGALRG